MLNSSDSSRSCRSHAELWMGHRLSSRTHNRLLCSKNRGVVSILFLILLACSGVFPEKANLCQMGLRDKNTPLVPAPAHCSSEIITWIAVALPVKAMQLSLWNLWFGGETTGSFTSQREGKVGDSEWEPSKGIYLLSIGSYYLSLILWHR